MNEIIEAWQIHNRIHLYLLDAIPEDHLATKVEKAKAVGDQFAHVHNVRLMWIKVAAPDLLGSQTKIEGKIDREGLKQRLTESSVAIEKIFRRAGSPDGKVKGFKPHAAAYLGYLVAHESFHRAHVELALRQAGQPLSDKVSYGTWEWGVR